MGNGALIKMPLTRVQALLQIVMAIVLIAYPFGIYFGMTYWGLGVIAPLILLAFISRLIFVRAKLREMTWLLKSVSLIGGLLALASWGLKQTHWLLYYPVVVNLALLLFFVYSLFNPPSVIERLARLTEPNLPTKAIAYTRRVTKVWCAFFLINGSIALFICFAGDIKTWTLYNGVISYLLIGVLMSVEWLIRQKIRRG